MLQSSTLSVCSTPLSGVSSQAQAPNFRTYEFTNSRNYARNAITSLLDKPSRQRRRRMPLARCQAMADTREIIEIKFDLNHKLNKE